MISKTAKIETTFEILPDESPETLPARRLTSPSRGRVVCRCRYFSVTPY